MKKEYRVEKDLLGEKEVPSHVYWGIHTARAKENFPLSGYLVPQPLIQALAMVKKACCIANAELGYLKEDVAQAIEESCNQIIEGKLAEQFPLDALQGGAGTSTNMNINEVITNRACELLGSQKGDHARVHPIEHVNLHQSTNDVYPTALKIAAIRGIRKLSQIIARVQGAFQRKEKEFSEIVSMGRTEMQDAVPIALGGQFASFAEALARDRWRTFKCEERLRVVNIGGTAVGTGLTAPREYIFLVIERLRDVTGLGLTRGEHVMDQTSNADCFVEASGMLNAHAANLIKISRDLRLLHFMREIELPALQAGSSIMPGKVNPVLIESAISVAMKVQANDTLIARAASNGTLQINEFLPLIAFSFLESIGLLCSIGRLLDRHVRTIRANPDICSRNVDKSPLLITAFLPYIGYEAAQDLLRDFKQEGDSKQERDSRHERNGSFREFLCRRLGEDLVDKVLSPHNLMALGYRKQ